MGTTADKLNKLKATKEAIRTAINNKGGTLTTSDKFSDYATAIDNIQSGGGDNPLQYIIDNRGGDGKPSCDSLFQGYFGSSLDNVINQCDFSKVKAMSYMFSNCENLTKIPLMDTRNINTMQSMFNNCLKLTTIPQLDMSSCVRVNYMFSYCSNLTTIPQLNTIKVQTFQSTFENCLKLTTIAQLDMSSCTVTQGMFNYCEKLTYLKLLNIKTSLQIGSGTSWGHLIEKDCLIQIISELIKPSSGTATLTMGTANKAKIADTYVKLLADDGTGKYPFEVCTSTDEGAMTIEAYCNSKNWTLA